MENNPNNNQNNYQQQPYGNSQPPLYPQYPQKPYKPFYQKVWFWVLMSVLFLFVVLTMCIFIGIPMIGRSSSSSESTSSGNDHTYSVTSATEGESEDTNVDPIGKTVTVRDLKLTIESFGTIEDDNEFNKPDEGKEFVEIVMLAENTSKDNCYFSSADFDAYLDGFAIDEDFSCRSASDNEYMSATLASGKKFRGSLCYQLPKDWKELEIIIDLNTFIDNDEVTLTFLNQ